MVKLIKSQIKELKAEITSIDLTSSIQNLKMTDEDNIEIISAKSKIKILNKLLILHGIQ